MNHESHINWLEIKNFKSIKATNFDCKRINVFIGKPNVGKSNILEAVGLLGGYNGNLNDKVFSEIVRYKNFGNLFYNNDRNLKIEVNANLGYFLLKYNFNNNDRFNVLYTSSGILKDDILNDDSSSHEILDRVNKFKTETSLDDILYGKLTPTTFFTVNFKDEFDTFPNVSTEKWGNIRKYVFQKDIKSTRNSYHYLYPPNGDNWVRMLEIYPDLFDEIAEIFDSYGLQAVIDQEFNEFEIQKVVNRKAYKTPYSLMADTLQRYIFNLLAIKTNKNSIIVLEEPEAHSFPTYISKVGSEIVNDKNNNQYFIATHSPYLLQEFIENTDPNDLALFVCDYKNYETVIKSLTREEIDNITETDIDLFYNIKAFQNDND